MPFAQPLRIDARLGGEHALHERLLTHFEREERDRNVLLDRGVLRDVEHERGLSHRRTRGDDDEIRRLEARRELVEIGEAARDAGDGLAAALQRLDALHRRPDQLLDAREALQPALLADLEDLLLRVVEQLVGRRAPLERLADDRRRHLDEPAQQRLLAARSSRGTRRSPPSAPRRRGSRCIPCRRTHRARRAD